jgi:hypothetical protein
MVGKSMKVRFNFTLIAILLIGIVATLYTNCSKSVDFRSTSRTQGTVTGNPIAPSSSKILSGICKVLTECNATLTAGDCETGVLQTGGMNAPLGLPDTLDTYADILQAEQSGVVVGNSGPTDTCVAAIRSLSCADPAVESAYDPDLSNPFSAVSGMIPIAPGSCAAALTPAPTPEYYVSTTGSDTSGDGTSAKPWASITYASENLIVGSQGATVHVAPGVYSPVGVPCASALGGYCAISTTKSGASASARIVYVSDQKWGAKIKPASDGYLIWVNTGDYVDIVGFDISGDPGSNVGIDNRASYVRVIGNHVHDIPVTVGCANGDGGSGIKHRGPLRSTWEGHDNETIGNVVHDIGPLKPDGLPFASYCNHTAGISINNSKNKTMNNIVYRIATHGYCDWQSATNNTVANNLIFNNGATRDDRGFIGGAILIGAGDSGTAVVNDYTTVINNIIRNARGVALYEYGNTGIHNIYKNNLLFGNAGPIILNNGLTALGTITLDPLMVNFRLDGTGDYRLTSSSPAINAGTLTCATGVTSCTPSIDLMGISRPVGPTIDIGPYEFQ